MAEVDFDEFEDAVYAPPDPGARRARLAQAVNYLGAASSLALIVLLAVWGTRLLLRDVNGVPVMRALEGAMRIAPADPGGKQASNQGLSVNAVASTGIASPVPDELNLAPAPTALAAEDLPGLAAAPLAGLTAGRVTPAPEPIALANLAPAAEPPAPAQGGATAFTGDTTADAVALAVAEAMALGPESAAPATGPEAAAAGPGLAVSLVPRARPGAALSAVTGVSGAVAAVAAGASEVDPATIAVGTRLAQLGAYATTEEARAKWASLTNRYPEVMAGKTLVIQPAQSGGQTFFRLRALGFADEEETRQFCAVLLSGNADCIPVAQR